LTTRKREIFKKKNDFVERTHHHLDKHHFVHHNRYNRNQDHMKMYHQLDEMDDDDVDFENANKNMKMGDV